MVVTVTDVPGYYGTLQIEAEYGWRLDDVKRVLQGGHPRRPHPVGRLGLSCIDPQHSIQHASFPFEAGRYALAVLLA